MKKKITVILGFLLLIALTTSSCKKDKNDDIVDSEKCDQLADTYYQAVVNYSANPNKETCENFVQATENYIEGCAILTPQQKQEFQQAINEADCTGYPK